jgi:hypothetical protein
MAEVIWVAAPSSMSISSLSSRDFPVIQLSLDAVAAITL